MTAATVVLLPDLYRIPAGAISRLSIILADVMGRSRRADGSWNSWFEFCESAPAADVVHYTDLLEDRYRA